MLAKAKLVRSNTCSQLWIDSIGYTLFYPMKAKSEASWTISKMVHDMQGILEVIVSDGVKEETIGTNWQREIWQI